MNKILLINPPVRKYEQSSIFEVHFPLSLLYVAAKIKDLCEIKILDCLITDFEIKKENDYTMYGAPFSKIESEIRKFNPDIVGISTTFTSQSDIAKIICDMCKKINPKMLVVFGGSDASVRYSQLLKETNADFCVIGEGELTFFELVKKFSLNQPLNRIAGLAYKKNNKIHFNPPELIENLDALPFPAYELIDFDAYFKNDFLYKDSKLTGKRAISVVTSRGCPYNCVFCSIKLHMGNRYRCHSPDYVIKHLELLKNKYGITDIHFNDDNLSLDKKRFNQILDKIIDSNLNIKWDTPNGIRGDTLDFDMLKKIKKSGSMRLTFAVESGNQDVLNNIIKKNTSLEYLEKVFCYCKKLGIRISVYYVIGFPNETKENMVETMDFALRMFRKYDAFPSPFIATPMPGTELYNICIEKGYIKNNLTNKDFSIATRLSGEPLISTEDFSKEDVKDVIRYYFSQLKKESQTYYLKHPLITIKKIIIRPKSLIAFLGFSGK